MQFSPSCPGCNKFPVCKRSKHYHHHQEIETQLMGFASGFLGDIDEAINWLEKAYNDRDAYLCIINFYPWMPIKLRQYNRFQSFLSKMNFPK